MNKDKIIKDLKQRNDKLANQYRLRDIRCVHLEYENNELKKQLEEIKEYTKNKLSTYPDNLTNEMMEQKWLKDILNIIDKKVKDI